MNFRSKHTYIYFEVGTNIGKFNYAYVILKTQIYRETILYKNDISSKEDIGISVIYLIFNILLLLIWIFNLM